MTDDPEVAALRATNLLQRARDLDDAKGLDDAILLLRGAVQAIPPEHPRRPTWLSTLSAALQLRSNRTGSQPDLHEAIIASRSASDATAHPDRPMHLSNLATSLQARFQREGIIGDLNAAIDAARGALDALPEGHRDIDRSAYLSNLGGMLQTRFGLTGKISDLVEAITMCQEAVDATPTGHPNLSRRLSNLSGGLAARFQHIGREVDLHEALDAIRRAASAAPEHYPDRPRLLSYLSNLLRIKFRHTGQLADLNEAIQASHSAVAAIPKDHSFRAGAMLNLSSALRARFERTGEPIDLNEAIRLGRQTVAAVPVGHPDRTSHLSNLTTALRIRFGRTGSLADLHHAIAAARTAVAETRADQPHRSTCLTVLASSLRDRFERIRNLGDLDEAIAAGREALTLARLDRPERPMYLGNLGNLLRLRFELTHQQADLDEAITLIRAAVDGTPRSHPDHGQYLSNLSHSLRTRHVWTQNLADRDAALAAAQAAIDMTAIDHPGRARMLSNLANALSDRAAQTGDHAHLNAAISEYHAALDALPTDHPDRAGTLSNLAAASYKQFDQVGDLALATTAVRKWEEAAEVNTAPTAMRVHAARAAGELAASLGNWTDATGAYSRAVQLLPMLAWRGSDQPSREHLLASWAGLAGNAAASAIMAAQPQRAAELLDQGRNVLWSQLLETRVSLEQVHRDAPELAARLEDVGRGLEHLTDPGGESVFAVTSTTGADISPAADRRMALARQWDELVEEVRNLDGLEDFLKPPRLGTLLPAAADGPVAIVNVSRWRCDALVVRTSGVEVVELPNLTLETVADHTSDYLRVLHKVDRAAYTLYCARQRYDDGDRSLDSIRQYTAAKQSWQRAANERDQTLGSLLEWLWDTVADPVLTFLGFGDTPPPDQPWPRMWWCPTGPLTLLPLHAAGYHDQADPPARRTVLDRVVSSYTPTLRALLEARRPLGSPPEDARILIVALADTADEAPLAAVHRERDLLASRFSPKATLLEGAHATAAAVQEDLSRHRWAHFCCHGGQDLTDPSQGGLLLHDRTLTIAEISARQHNGEFAFLSACMTAVGGVNLPDEAITLAAALHYTGYRQVIGTLWSVYDETAADVAELVYANLTSSGTFAPGRSAHALHHAIRHLRDIKQLATSAWTPFTHTGP